MDAVETHYASPDLLKKIRAGLETIGKSPKAVPSAIVPRDLAAVDQLHTGGAPATIALMKTWQEAGPRPQAPSILDAGCGTGGSSRLLAQQFGCRVTGMDLSRDFIHTAETLTQWCGLKDRVGFRQGSVLDLPFDDGSFDAVLCQHLLLNIQDKDRALGEFFRVIKPGGSLILHDIVKGEGPEPLMPVPWAADESTSFLVPWEEMEKRICRTGFSFTWQKDETEEATRWWQKNNSAAGKRVKPPPLYPGLVFGKNAKKFGPNMEKNFSFRAVRCISAICSK